MRDVHRLIADEVLLTDRFEPMVQQVLARKLEPTGQSVGIVGAGPAGLSCAYYLALLGHSVTVYESRPQAGGMLRYALPEYRLPKKVLDKEIELIERLGVKFEFGVSVGDGRGLNDLADKHEIVFLSIGTWEENWVHLAGTELTRRDPGAALPGGRRARREGGDRREGRGHRRRQRRHRLGSHRPPPGRGRDDRLPARAQGHAGHPGGDRGRRARGRQAALPARPRTRSWATRTAG